MKPHSLRHTAVTWLMQPGQDLNEICGFAGVTAEELQRTYLHHYPDFQTGIAGAKMRKQRRDCQNRRESEQIDEHGQGLAAG